MSSRLLKRSSEGRTTYPSETVVFKGLGRSAQVGIIIKNKSLWAGSSPAKMEACSLLHTAQALSGKQVCVCVCTDILPLFQLSEGGSPLMPLFHIYQLPNKHCCTHNISNTLWKNVTQLKWDKCCVCLPTPGNLIPLYQKHNYWGHYNRNAGRSL